MFLLLYRKHVDMVVRCGGRKVISSNIIKSLSLFFFKVSVGYFPSLMSKAR